MAILEIKNLAKSFSERPVFAGLSFSVEKGEFLSILGASGCGKTTLLRILIGIETPDLGKIIKDGLDITSAHPSRRGMGIVFQNYALFPNLTVLENVLLPLSYKSDDKQSNLCEARNIIDKVGLSPFSDKKPSQLSGGQQQRAAIARTLALSPEIMIFDEPMSALDASNRIALRNEFKSIQKEFAVTMIYVTHDQEEAFAMSDRIMVMNNGHIEQIDTPSNIYNEPASDFIKTFIIEHLDSKMNSIRETTRRCNG